MSVTPDNSYTGEAECYSCGEKLTVNDYGVTYRHRIKLDKDLLFCPPCTVRITRSMAQDLLRMPDFAAFSPGKQYAGDASISYDHVVYSANALRRLVDRLDDHAKSFRSLKCPT